LKKVRKKVQKFEFHSESEFFCELSSEVHSMLLSREQILCTRCWLRCTSAIFLTIGQVLDTWFFSYRYNAIITGWAVTLTCYISHGAKHRKMADFDPSGSQNPWTDFDETWNYVRDPIPH